MVIGGGAVIVIAVVIVAITLSKRDKQHAADPGVPAMAAARQLPGAPGQPRADQDRPGPARRPASRQARSPYTQPRGYAFETQERRWSR